jgi:hypothetical protein
MQQRPSANDVTTGLATISDKIRALARAGYDRTEISKLLKIRYQHVRNVLVDAGITGGLSHQVEADREPVIVDAAPASRELTSWDVLLRAGFQFIGEWAQAEGNTIRLEANAPAKPGVYAFVLDDAVAYVGLTNSDLRTRFDQYRRGHAGQRTNARLNGLIAKALAEGKKIKVLVATPDSLEWNGLPVNTAAGLEAALIQKIRPAWNIMGAV